MHYRGEDSSTRDEELHDSIEKEEKAGSLHIGHRITQGLAPFGASSGL